MGYRQVVRICLIIVFNPLRAVSVSDSLEMTPSYLSGRVMEVTPDLKYSSPRSRESLTRAESCSREPTTPHRPGSRCPKYGPADQYAVLLSMDLKIIFRQSKPIGFNFFIGW